MVIVDSTDMLMSLAPPSYSQDSPEAPDCRFSWEQPPPYSEVESIQQGHMDAEELRERLSGHWGKNSFCLTGWEKKRNADCRSGWLPHQAEWESSRTTGNVFMSLDRSSAKRRTAEMCWHHLSAMNLQPSVCHPSAYCKQNNIQLSITSESQSTIIYMNICCLLIRSSYLTFIQLGYSQKFWKPFFS